MRKLLLLFFFCLLVGFASGQQQNVLAPTPPMGWMTWNFFADRIHEKEIREIADAMVMSGMVEAGYNYLFIDDGWQGGRDNRNNIIPDPVKFPSGMKALAEYVHSKGMKLGIYSDAAPLTCAGYTASLGFEEQDAKTFASWGIDYLKYDYCHAPKDSATAVTRYARMSEALRKSGREIVFSVCEWGQLKPWHWAAEAGGQLWRTSYDVRDKWKNLSNQENAEGILDIIDINADLYAYAGPGRWNDADMLVVGLYGKPGPSGDMGGVGMNDVQYQSQMSLWSVMASPLIATNDVRNMNEATRRILLNKEVIAVNQDRLGKQAERKVNDGTWNVFVKELENGDYAVAILNRTDGAKNYSIDWAVLGLGGRYEVRDLWEHKSVDRGKGWKGRVLPHETKLFRLRKI